jgi:hypothetical protein
MLPTSIGSLAMICDREGYAFVVQGKYLKGYILDV